MIIAQNNPPQDTGVWNWLQTNGWVIAIIGIVISAGLALFLHRRSRQHKTLDYEILDDAVLFYKEAKKFGNNITMSVDGVEVVHPRLIRVRFVNTGSEVIEGDDFNKPVTVTKPCNIVSIESESAKVSVHVELSGVADAKQVNVTPDLLNRKDEFVIKLIVDSDKNGLVEPTCRLKGETRSSRAIRVASAETMRIFNFASVVGSVIPLVMIVILYLLDKGVEPSLGIGLVLTIVTLFGFGFVTVKSLRKELND